MAPEELHRFIVATEMTEDEINKEMVALTCTPAEVLNFVISFGCFPTKNDCDVINWHTIQEMKAQLKRDMMQTWYVRLK